MHYFYCCSIIDLTENTITYKKYIYIYIKNLKKIGNQNSKTEYLYGREINESNHSFMPVTLLMAKWRTTTFIMLCNMQSHLANIILTQS